MTPELTQQSSTGITNATPVPPEELTKMLSLFSTEELEKVQKKVKAPKKKRTGCEACPLHKTFINTPVYTRNLLVPFKEIRETKEEKVVVLLIPHPYSEGELLPFKAREMIGSWTSKYLTEATKIYLFPVIQCPHTKDPSKSMVTFCSGHLKSLLVEASPDVIICLGKSTAIPFGLDGQAKEIYNRFFVVKPIKNGEKESKECKLIATHDPEKFMDDIKVIKSVESVFMQTNNILSGATQTTPDRYYLIDSPEEFETWVNRHLTDERLNKLVHAFDIETNGREIHPCTQFDLEHPAKLRCISFSWGQGMAICVPTEDNEAAYLPILKRFMESDIKFIGHNVSFDYFFLKIVNKITPKNIVGDTMNMAFLCGFGGYAGLKPLAAQLTGLGGYETDMKSTPDEEDEDGNIIVTKWEKADIKVVSPYNCADADATLQIYKIFLKQIKEQDMMPAHWIMTKALITLGEMEHNGIYVNKEWVNNARSYMEGLLEQYKSELKSLCNGKEFDWNSPQEMARVLYDLFNYQVPIIEESSTNADDDNSDASRPTGDVALSMINTPFTQALRKYRKCSKLLSTYFNGYLSNTALDGCLRARYNLTGTATGRLSSGGGKSAVNMQNIPSSMAPTDPGYEDLHEYKIKKAFTPRNPGWVMVNLDQSQLILAAVCSNAN